MNEIFVIESKPINAPRSKRFEPTDEHVESERFAYYALSIKNELQDGFKYRARKYVPEESIKPRKSNARPISARSDKQSTTQSNER